MLIVKDNDIFVFTKVGASVDIFVFTDGSTAWQSPHLSHLTGS